MNTYKILLIPGEGIGPELTEATLAILESAQAKFDLKLDIVEAEAGDATFKKRGASLPADTVEK
ncbi:MAG TPA: isocitrate/isopropylmalate family dehydrogenase, partial [Candidatus Bathyarchaeia archaeon]